MHSIMREKLEIKIKQFIKNKIQSKVILKKGYN